MTDSYMQTLKLVWAVFRIALSFLYENDFDSYMQRLKLWFDSHSHLG